MVLEASHCRHLDRALREEQSPCCWARGVRYVPSPGQWTVRQEDGEKGGRKRKNNMMCGARPCSPLGRVEYEVCSEGVDVLWKVLSRRCISEDHPEPEIQLSCRAFTYHAWIPEWNTAPKKGRKKGKKEKKRKENPPCCVRNRWYSGRETRFKSDFQ